MLKLRQAIHPEKVKQILETVAVANQFERGKGKSKSILMVTSKMTGQKEGVVINVTVYCTMKWHKRGI